MDVDFFPLISKCFTIYLIMFEVDTYGAVLHRLLKDKYTMTIIQTLCGFVVPTENIQVRPGKLCCVVTELKVGDSYKIAVFGLFCCYSITQYVKKTRRYKL